MSETRLAILSLLRHGPLHGYEIKKTLERECIDMWSTIPLATVYNELNKMGREGLIEKAGIEVESGRARSMYDITENGRSAFADMVREVWLVHQPVPFPLFFAVAALDVLPQEELVELIRRRIRIVEKQCEIVEPQDKSGHVRDGPFMGVQAVTDRFRSHLQAELGWLQELLTHTENDLA
ncbi:MAG: PadR family transcriptional regulator [Chloroflexi bacterium]|nr:PadR family transcriptional regulator [Chloroflexota bacterium]